jgi:hypothetical protein
VIPTEPSAPEDKVVSSRACHEDLCRDESGRLWIVFHAKERVSNTHISGSLVVRSNDPEHNSLFEIAPAEAKSREIVLDEAGRSRVIGTEAST